MNRICSLFRRVVKSDRPDVEFRNQNVAFTLLPGGANGSFRVCSEPGMNCNRDSTNISWDSNIES